ncbi:MAG: anti-sigma F factor [Clostridia bacterium]|nr:anti-sigma F factor [Clostridia bacterium]
MSNEIEVDNEFTVYFDAKLENEGFARSMVSAFCLQLNPTVSEISDIKTAVSEAVTNSIIHGYANKKGKIMINVKIKANVIYITIADNGVGIADISQARQPFFTTKAKEERSGMGFTLMESFMDALDVRDNPDGGLIVSMKKIIRA